MQKRVRVRMQENLRRLVEFAIREDVARGQEAMPLPDCPGCLALKRLAKFAGVSDAEFKSAWAWGLARRTRKHGLLAVGIES